MIKILCVGKIKEKYLKDLIDDYLNRIKKYHKIEIIEVKDSNIVEEEQLLMKHIDKNDYVISLCIEGEMLSSVEFKNKIVNLFNESISNITFVIGGSDGLTDVIKNNSDYKLSFSKLTFPHGLFRGILLEQIYRAFKIMNNEKYHK